MQGRGKRGGRKAGDSEVGGRARKNNHLMEELKIEREKINQNNTGGRGGRRKRKKMIIWGKCQTGFGQRKKRAIETGETHVSRARKGSKP